MKGGRHIVRSVERADIGLTYLKRLYPSYNEASFGEYQPWMFVFSTVFYVVSDLGHTVCIIHAGSSQGF